MKAGDTVTVKSAYLGGKDVDTTVVRVSAKSGIITVKYLDMRFRPNGTAINANPVYSPRLVEKKT
jgi:hypothetical protein